MLRVLCLTPDEVFEPAYRKARSTLPPHLFEYWQTDAGASLLEALARANVVIGDWTGFTVLGPGELRAATHCDTILQPTAGYNCIDVVAAATAASPCRTPRAPIVSRSRSGSSWPRCCC